MIIGTLKILYNGLTKSYHSWRLKPTDAILFLTYRCTSQCKTCNIWKRPVDKDRELTWKDWKSVFEKMARSGIKSIEMFGGDALLRKDLLLDMLSFCKENNIETYFPTNSNLLDEETIKDLLKAGLNTIYFSLDELPGIDSEIRGDSEHYNKVTNAISLTVKNRHLSNKLNIVCISTISKYNYSYLDKLVQTTDLLGVDRHVLRGMSEFPIEAINKSVVDSITPEPYFMPIVDGPNYLNRNEAKQLLETVEEIKNHQRNNKSIVIDTKNLDDLTEDLLVNWRYPKAKCYFCTNTMILDPSANVLPCPYYNKYILGNLCAEKTSEVWGNERHRWFNRLQKNQRLELCQYCSIKFYHQGFPESLSYVIKKIKSKYSK